MKMGSNIHDEERMNKKRGKMTTTVTFAFTLPFVPTTLFYKKK